MEGDLAGVRLAECGEHVDITGVCHRRNFAHQTAFADARRADHSDHSALPSDCTLQQPLNGGHLPAPTDQIRLSTPDGVMPFSHAQQAMGGHWFLGTLNVNELSLTHSGCAIN